MRNKDIKEKIMEFFFTNPTSKLRVRQLERTLELSFPSVISYLKKLEQEGIIKKEKISGITLFSADRSSKKFLIEKGFSNIRILFKSELVEHLIDEYHNPTIVLFGSYSKGEDIETSDIDLYIETPSKKEINLDQFEKKVNRKIQIFKY